MLASGWIVIEKKKRGVVRRITSARSIMMTTSVNTFTFNSHYPSMYGIDIWFCPILDKSFSNIQMFSVWVIHELPCKFKNSKKTYSISMCFNFCYLLTPVTVTIHHKAILNTWTLNTQECSMKLPMIVLPTKSIVSASTKENYFKK